MTKPNEGRITDETVIGTGICHGDLCDEGEHEINLTDLSPEYRQILLNHEAQTARLNEAMELLTMAQTSENCEMCSELEGKCDFHQRYEALKNRQPKPKQFYEVIKEMEELLGE